MEEINDVITIKFDENESFNISTNNPDVSGFVNKIIELKDRINFDNIEVCSNIDTFDSKSFKDIIVDAIKDFLNKIKFEEKDYNDFINQIKKNK